MPRPAVLSGGSAMTITRWDAAGAGARWLPIA
jgi:hypothetical protein